MELPEFSGGVREWKAFYSVFKGGVHDNKSTSNNDKINYLVGRLKGPVLSLANPYLKQILDFKTLQGESDRGLNSFLESFDVAVNALKRLNLPDLSDFIFLFFFGSFQIRFRNRQGI
nr:unnamed protein product [Callosobruchus analis]